MGGGGEGLLGGGGAGPVGPARRLAGARWRRGPRLSGAGPPGHRPPQAGRGGAAVPRARGRAALLLAERAGDAEDPGRARRSAARRAVRGLPARRRWGLRALRAAVRASVEAAAGRASPGRLATADREGAGGPGGARRRRGAAAAWVAGDAARGLRRRAGPARALARARAAHGDGCPARWAERPARGGAPRAARGGSIGRRPLLQRSPGG